MYNNNVIDDVSDKVRETLGEIELSVLTEGLTLASLIREGSGVSDQAYDWTDDEGGVCALSAAEAALRARTGH